MKKAVKAPNEYCLPPNGLLEEYEKLIFQNSEDSVVLNRTMVSSDLATLSGRSWLSLAVIQGVLDIVNSQSSDTRAFILNDLIGLKGSALQKLVQTQNGKIKFISFIINVGGDIRKTFVATPSKPERHWTLLFIDTVENKWFYCDTLGWALPGKMNDIVVHILDDFSKTTMIKKPVQGRFLAHKENRSRSTTHQCSNNCFRNIPLQTCGNICGVIATILAAVSGLDQALWRQGFLNQKVPLPEPIAWMLTPTAHEDYLRHILIHWLVAKQVDLKMLGVTNSHHYEDINPLSSTTADDTSESYTPAYEGTRTGVDQTAQCHLPPTGIAPTDNHTPSNDKPTAEEAQSTADEPPQCHHPPTAGKDPPENSQPSCEAAQNAAGDSEIPLHPQSPGGIASTEADNHSFE